MAPDRRDRRRRARRLRRVPRRSRTAASSPATIAVFGPDADPAAAWRPPRRGDPAARDALGERRPLPARRPSPAWRSRAAMRRRKPGRSRRRVCDRYRPTVARVPRPRRGAAARAKRLGRRASFPAASTGSRGRRRASTLDGRGAASPARAARARPPRPLAPGGARATTRGPSTPTSRTTTPTTSRSSAPGWPPRPSGCNALAAGAQVISVRRREPVAAAAQPAAAALLARGLRRFHATPPEERAALLAGSPRRPTRPAAAGTSRSSARRGGPLPGRSRRVNGAEQVICATGFQRGFRPRSPARGASPPSTGSPPRQLARPRPRLHRPGADGRRRGRSVARRRRGAVGLPGRRHAGRGEVRGARLPAEGAGMSYTLRGRLESRLLAALGPAVLAAVPRARACTAGGRSSSPARWSASGSPRRRSSTTGCSTTSRAGPRVPLGLLELGLVTGIAVVAGIRAPLGAAVAFFAASWLLGQVLAHALFPWLRLSYAEDGGELGRTGASAGAAVAALFLVAAGRRLRHPPADGAPLGRRPPGAARDRPRGDPDGQARRGRPGRDRHPRRRREAPQHHRHRRRERDRRRERPPTSSSTTFASSARASTGSTSGSRRS